MPHRNVLILLISAGALALAGCQANGQKETGGTVLGAAAGGLLGSQVGAGRGKLVGTALGTLAGAVLGAEIGRSLDNADRAMARWTKDNPADTARSRQAARWSDPDRDAARPAGRQRMGARQCKRSLQAAAETHDDDAVGIACGQASGMRAVVD